MAFMTTSITTCLLAVPGVLALCDDSTLPESDLPVLAPPFIVEADGVAIEAKMGHAAPFVTDFDGDGVWDLAVGEFGDGGCRLYRNLGTTKAPKFGAFTMLQSNGVPAAMESG